MTWTGMLIGEGFEGSGSSAAHINAVLGDRTSPVAQAWVSALASPSAGHAPFMVVARPGLPVKPFTLFVPKATVSNPDHAEVTWGAAQAGVAAGVVEAVRMGVVPAEVAEDALLICAVWVDPAATVAHSDVIFLNNRAATITALEAAGHRRPTVEEVLADDQGVWNPFYSPPA
ncbi:MAG: formaldehyde-activating enzyme [Acidimicrobiales bacterium]